jgi:hypothetical protein
MHPTAVIEVNNSVTFHVPPNRHLLGRQAHRNCELQPGPESRRPEPGFHITSVDTKQRPAEFWERLSQIWLTETALTELDRRTIDIASLRFQVGAREPHGEYAPDFLSRCGSERLGEIKQFARHGGPDLSDLRNVPGPR